MLRGRIAGGWLIPATNRGFSLIEVLIVVAVIAVLMSIAAPNFATNMRRGKERALRNDLALTRAALSSFYGDTGCFPNALSALTTSTAPTNCINLSGTSRALDSATFQGPYLPYVPEDSVSRQALTYSAAAGSVGTVRSSASGNDLAGNAFSTY